MSTLDLTGVNTVAFDVYASRTGSNLKFGLHNASSVATNINLSNTTASLTGSNTQIGATSLMTDGALGAGCGYSGGASMVATFDEFADSYYVTSVRLDYSFYETLGGWSFELYYSGGWHEVMTHVDYTTTGGGGASPTYITKTGLWTGVTQARVSGSASGSVVKYVYVWEAEVWGGLVYSSEATTEITPNITQANTWQTVVWDLSAVADADKNNIDQFIITVVNADAENTFYVDNFRTYNDPYIGTRFCFPTFFIQEY